MPRYQHCAFSVDGSIYVCGGFGRDDNVLSSVEHFIANDSRGWMELSEKMKQKRYLLNYLILNYVCIVFSCRLKNMLCVCILNRVIIYSNILFILSNFVYFSAMPACCVLNNIAYGFLHLTIIY